MRLRCGVVRGVEVTDLRLRTLAHAIAVLDCRAPPVRRLRGTWYALLQHELRRLDGGVGMEASADQAREDRVGDRDDRHALVMRHEGTDDGDRPALDEA